MFHYYDWLIYKASICVVFTATACLCIGYTSYAQNNNYRFENITSEQGLADRLVNTIIQDAQGFMWFGSAEGLTKYDGYNCTVYRHKTNDRYSLSDNEVHALCVDNAGTLWIGTHNGLNRYDAKNNRFDVFLHDSTNENSITGNEIYALTKDASGNLLIGTMDGGMDMMIKTRNEDGDHKKNYRFIHYRHNIKDSNSLSDNRILSIIPDDYKNIWVGTASGLNVLNTRSEKFTRFYSSETTGASIGKNIINKIYKDINGDIWLCGNGMLDKIDVNFFYTHKSLSVKHLTFLNSSQKTNDLVINDFFIDSLGNTWIATNNIGLLKCNTGKNGQLNLVTQFINARDQPYSLVNSTVYSLYADKSGVVWIGTAKGVSKYTPFKERFNESAYIHELLPMHKSFVMALLADQQERLWIGYDSDTLNLITGTNRGIRFLRNIILTPVIEGDQVNAIFQSKPGEIYIGTLLNGLYIIPPGLSNVENKSGWKHIDATQNSLLPSNNIYAIAEDGRGRIWIGTYTGLCMYDPATGMIQAIYVSPQRKVIADYIIRSVVIDERDIIWCGTDNGIYCIQNGKIIQSFRNNEQDSNTLSNNRVTSLMIDHAQNIWVGTREGLNVYDVKEKKFYRFTTENGLSNDGIRSIKEDKKNNIWIATDHGLSRYDVNNKMFYNYSVADGLYSDQFIVNAVTEDADGIFYFGTNSGTVSFNPSKILVNTFIPPVVFTDIKILNTPIALFKDTMVSERYQKENKLVLNYNQNFFSFEFAALNYINSAANKYAYQLEGIDKDWNQAGNQRFAGYTDIKPGTYTFKVKASNNDGVWNETPATIAVIITPPWWQTWWFYALCAVTTCVIVYLIYRIRLQQVLKLYRLRSSIAKDLHDDVGSALSSIALLSRVAQEGKTNTQLKPDEIFLRIGDTSKQMIDLMDDIVWSVNPDNDRFTNMLVRMREYAAEMLETKNIDFSFTLPVQADEMKIPMQMRKDYFLIFKEAINNLAKYSNATRAAIIIERSGHNLITKITDNGNGFDLSSIHAGNGLKNMQSRATTLNGKFIIETGKNKGTCIILSMPVT